MKHSIDPDELGELGLPIIDAIQKCVHCGFCLPTCPTYELQKQEMDSPRGRILLMKEVLEGNLDANDAAPYVDRCLGCLACETSCPSGVPYGHLHSAYQSVTRTSVSKGSGEKIREFFVHQTVPFAGRFRMAARLGKLVEPLRFLAPKSLRPMLGLIPGKIPSKQILPAHSPAIGKPIGRVGLLSGCAQQVLAPEINLSTIRVLNRAGFDVVTPASQGCCGALDWHEGRLASARKMAVRNFDQFPDDLDAIITNAAGCGSAIQEYKIMFGQTDFADAAQRFANRVVDISTFLAEHGLPEAKLSESTRIAYHDACHLAHAQGIRNAPRQLLGQIENVELVPLADPERCCGSAGTYNLKQPKIAAELGKLKVKSILESDCQIVAAGNIGCLIQIQKYLRDRSDVQALHTIQILELATRDARLIEA